MSNSTGARGSVETLDKYEEIEQAVLETPRGRWFLQEFARRQRGVELTTVLAAIQRLEKAVATSKPVSAENGVSRRLAQAIQMIEQARTEPLGPEAAPLEAGPLKYFATDEEFFAGTSAPPPKPEAAEPARDSRDDRLTIHRAPERDRDTSPPLLHPGVLAGETGAEAPPKRRIVIIRHKAGEEINVPLQNELAVGA